MVTQELQELALRQSKFLESVGADPALIVDRKLPCFVDSQQLVLAATSQSGREYLLQECAATAWTEMHAAATQHGISLIMISAFRSFDYQANLIIKKVAAGEPIDNVLATLAPPGCSEHHSGLACDIGTMGCPPAEEEFEETAAFKWLNEYAPSFGFSMSFPRDNPYGYIYEPWHWCFSDLG